MKHKQIKKELSKLITRIKTKQQQGPDPVITGLTYDSREVKPGSLFFALKGIHTDGHHYIEQAIDNGAGAIIHQDPLKEYQEHIAYIEVENTRTVMSPLAAAFYDYPAKKLTVLGVTGTDGKSTTVSFLYQLLNLTGNKTGFISTVQFDSGTGAVKNHYRQSTPEPSEVQKIIYQMVENKCTYAVIEATSHGLSPLNNRLGDVDFYAGLITNISHEHLEFHKTFERYIDDKANLFRALTGFGIINLDCPHNSYFKKAAQTPIYTYSLASDQADMQAMDVHGNPNYQEFTVHYQNQYYPVRLNMPGIFNIENILAALLMLTQLDPKKNDKQTDKSGKQDKTLPALIKHVSSLQPVKGRMNPIKAGQPFSVLVDYAHTPGAFKRLFPLLRPLVKGRLIALFSSAGERDLEKREQLGAIADAYSDIIILADEDPRGEIPINILRDVAKGCKNKTEHKDLFLIENRRQAIKTAFQMAEPDDLVLLLGKGHESTIIYAHGPISWDEGEVAAELLHETGYGDEPEHF